MKRLITGYHLDDEEHWVAELDCHHGQHVRHAPPLSERPWTRTAEGRASMLGVALDCVRCDDFEWPDGISAYKRTRTFTEDTVPKGLLADHQIKAGTWGRLHVESGALLYVAGARRETITPAAPGVIVPTKLHRVEPIGPVRFFVEFHRR